ncbi:MAG: ATP-binding protein [Chlamydiia bacterium]|nr:ATP-binding protein [Chlamydiia bacterium]
MFFRQRKLPQNHSFFLFGPRGTGKTTLLKAVFDPKHCLLFDLLEAKTEDLFFRNPDELLKIVRAQSDDITHIIIDEVQKIPELLNEVHRLIEERNIRFILTGSSARKLRQKGVNLLAGRAYTFHMYPLTCWELGDAFEISRALQWGMMPSIYDDGEDPKLYLQAYIETYLREEILQEGLTRSLSGFSRFLEVASFSQGETVNLSAIARDASLGRKVVENYFQILDDLLISYQLPIFSKRAKRDLVAHPKFYFFDPGVYQVLRPKGPWDVKEVIDGRSLETLFLHHLLSLIAYQQLDCDVFFWRTRHGQEVDFVVFGPEGIIAFEIKRSRKISGKDFRALHLFGEDYPEAKRYLLAGVESVEYHQGITVLPFEQALWDLPKILT